MCPWSPFLTDCFVFCSKVILWVRCMPWWSSLLMTLSLSGLLLLLLLMEEKNQGEREEEEEGILRRRRRRSRPTRGGSLGWQASSLLTCKWCCATECSGSQRMVFPQRIQNLGSGGWLIPRLGKHFDCFDYLVLLSTNIDVLGKELSSSQHRSRKDTQRRKKRQQ